VNLIYEAPSPTTTLKDVELVLVLWQEDGEKQKIKRYWAEWPAGGIKTIQVPPKTAYPEKIEVRGTAMPGDKRVRIEVSQGSRQVGP
jgi:hypothetical protein